MRFVKRAGAVLAASILLGACVFALAYGLGARKAQRTVEVRVVPVAAAKDPAALKHGKYLFETRGCGDCHGMDGRGRVLIDDPNGMFVRTPNLTAGRSSAVSAYGDGDWVRAIRHGVDPKGRPLLYMPSEDYNTMNDADLAALVGYMKSLPAADGEPRQVRFPAIVKAMYGVGLVHDAAEMIDHRRPPPPPVPVGATVEHGAYVANMCMGCHGPGLAGGRIPGTPPDWPPASNLTPGDGSAMARYDTVEKFAALLRTGRRPDGSAVSEVMPFESLRNLNDVDIAAIHAYLRSLAPRRAGER